MNHEENIENFRENGFVILKGVFDKESVSACAAMMSQYVVDVERCSTQNRDVTNCWYLNHRTDNGVLYDIYQRFPVTRKFCEYDTLLNFIHEYFNKSFYLYVNSYLYKPQGRQNIVPWHQDFLSRPNESEKILAWISLDHSNKDNGCLEVLPGSHKKGFRDWYTVKGETHHDRITLYKGEEDRKVLVETEPGDVVIFSNFLVHSSSQNDSDKPRRALRFVYKALDDNAIPRGSLLMMRSNVQDMYAAQDEKDNKTIVEKLNSRVKALLSN